MITTSTTVDDVLDLLVENERAARRALNMVPSENAMSGVAKLPFLLDVYHRYFFNERLRDEGWHFRGAQHVGALETELVLPLMRELAGAEFATVRPLSGLSAMSLVLASLGGPPGSTVVTVPPAQGGHYATPDIARRMGLHVEHLSGPDPHTVDYEAAEALVARVRPALVYVDQSNCLFPIDVARLVAAVRRGSPGTLVHVDSSHWLGLVLGGEFPKPLELGADSFGGSTHKTFPGPQKAIFATNRADLFERVHETQEFLISSHHFAAVLSLGLALLEFREFAPEYAAAVVAHTRRFGSRLHERGLPVVAADRGYSAGHQLWLDTEAHGILARDASQRLFEAGIRVNFLPDLPGFGARMVVRVGLNEVAYRGLDGDDVDELADVFVRAVLAEAPPEELAARVEQLRRSSRPRTEVAPEASGPRLAKALRLCATALVDEEPDELEPLLQRAMADQVAGAGAG